MSTAKSMAAQYLNGKRSAAASKSSTLTPNGLSNARFKSSTSNLSTASICTSPAAKSTRLKSTSMSSLAVGDRAAAGDTSESAAGAPSRLHRPTSRSALDSIHNGMNAKYAQVQSKVLLQNIRPQAGSPTSGARSPSRSTTRIPAGKRAVTPSRFGAPAGSAVKVPSERTVLLNKLKAQQEELDKLEGERQTLRQEVEREKSDKLEQIQQLKLELQEKMQEHDKQNEEYHQKLLEAYELADQNRRAADSVLSESRQRDEESRKKAEELEQQLAELREFVSMKEEMSNKMYELREQMRTERERYEEQLKSLHQIFENEKISEIGAKRQSSSPLGGPRSNYFNRPKQNLQSTESVDSIEQPAGHHELNASRAKGAKHQHRSEHDLLYGSKLSTRMQDTAKSAWKASKKIASSVITGAGGGLSACRKSSGMSAEGRRVGAPNEAANPNSAPCAELPNEQQRAIQVRVISTQPASRGREDPVDDSNDDDHLTSVIQVIGGGGSPATRLQHNSSQKRAEVASDDNTKHSLTIVTKFEDLSACSIGQKGDSAQQGSLTNTSERSRCESSSSGRGTSSDAGSQAEAAELTGGEHQAQQRVDSSSSSSPVQSEPSSAKWPSAAASQVSTDEAHTRRHRRKSSLFKASKILGGSQASLNKLKCFLVGAHAAATRTTGSPQNGAPSIAAGESAGFEQHSSHQQQLESSRLRFQELNQALKSAPKRSSFVSEVKRIEDDLNPVKANGTTGGELAANNNNVGEREESGDDTDRDGDFGNFGDLKRAQQADGVATFQLSQSQPTNQQQVVSIRGD